MYYSKTKQILSLFFLLVLGAIVLLSHSEAIAKESTLDKMLRTKEFHIGFVVLPPSISKDPTTNKPKGYYVDIAKFISNQINVKPIFHEETWATFISGLQAGKYDLSIASTFQTIPRALAVAFTQPLTYNGTSALALKTSNIRTLEDMKKPGIRIGVIQGAFMVDWVKRMFPEADIIESSVSAFVEPMNVITRRVDVSVTDSWVTRKFASEHSAVLDIFADNPQNIMPAGWMVRRDDIQLLNFINVAINYVKTTGDFKEIFERYDGFVFQKKLVWETWGKK